LNISSKKSYLIVAIWITSALAVAATVAVILVVSRRMEMINSVELPEMENRIEDRQVAARVDGSVIYYEDMTIVDISPSRLEEWLEDELLASLAVSRGLENVRKSRLIEARARQLYLRDELLSTVYLGIPFPDSAEVFNIMRSDSLKYMVERHYFQILVSDESTADSIHEKLSWGENFQITAERLSIGQKAGIGGDLGFLTAGELIAYGVPEEQAVIEDLGDVIRTDYGWHIFLVDEIRELEDTSRVVRSLADDIYRWRIEAARESLLVVAAEGRDVFLDSTLVYDNR